MRYTFNDEFANKGSFYAATHFLGVCEDYAEYMVALLRASGIPSRTVHGYKINEDSIDAYSVPLTVAHMWVEVYFNDVGWVFFDPTPSTGIPETLTLTDSNNKPVKVDVYKPMTTMNFDGFGITNERYYYLKVGYDVVYDSVSITSDEIELLSLSTLFSLNPQSLTDSAISIVRKK